MARKCGNGTGGRCRGMKHGLYNAFFNNGVDLLSSSQGGTPISSYTDLIAYFPDPAKYASNPVITADATYTNICPGGYVIDPADSTKFLLYVGEFLGNSRTGARIAVYRGSLSDPYTLTRVQTVLTATSSTFDSNGVSFGSVVQVGATIYLHYGAQEAVTLIESAGVATSTDGLNFTKVGQSLAPAATNADRGITDPTVIYVSGTFYMYATQKTGASAAVALPNSGLLIATSANGTTFTKTGTAAVTLGTGFDPDAKYIEGGQVIKLGSDYVLLYTANSASDLWSICLAVNSSSPTTTFTKNTTLSPILQHSGGSGLDAQSVAVPLLVQFPNNRWVCYYQGSAQAQPASVWNLFAFELGEFETNPAGNLNGKRGWTGSKSVFDIAGVSPVLAGSRSLRALTNLTAGPSISHAVTVNPGASSYFKCIMRANQNTGNFLGGFYAQEGSNIISGIYFHAGNISYLKNTGWTTIQAYSANTNYTVELFLINTTQVTIKINGSTVITAQTNFTTISSAANLIKIEKNTANAATVYFDSIECTDGTNTFTETFE